ncbi:TetR/AcrR family transcriptional regulator [Vineibacter terrae]|uniref:TetR/AcrR family transcriptional regulator n=1 Tax=Vineibacter terrae TaxID=2586908 RepID=A0A5C8PFW1_9HYPH|nr:TetR/AcrR family transcriptional regulator [Vineibacter terrae]TXL72693.1 TetR/AcrR family transcriptional regulator [Vineibacter terrae]
MTKRLTVQDWIDFALATLAQEGFHALKADVLARRLGVSRGSFYWHFADLEAFHARVIGQWRQTATEAIISGLERHEGHEQRLDVLLRGAFGHDSLLEVRMRAWADNNAAAARVVSDIDRRRRQYIERLLVAAGIAPALAATRAQLLYWTYLGAALSRSRLAGEQLDRVVAELKTIGLGGAAPPARGLRNRSGLQRV